MDTLEFFRRILPDKGIYVAAVPKVVVSEGKKKTIFIHHDFESLQEMASAVSEWDRNSTVYHACASYKDKLQVKPNGFKYGRTAKNVRACKSFWIDIDCGPSKAEKGIGYARQKDAADALSAFCKKREFPLPSLIVSSGYGLHCYWTLTKEIPVDEWYTTASGFKQLLAADGMLVDPSRTSDPASILRPVGTTNKKNPDTPKAVRLLWNKPDIEPEVFIEAVNKATATVGGLGEVPAWLKGETADNRVFLTFDYDANAIADKCAVMKRFRDTQGDLPYEAWRLAIGVLKYCNDGERLAHAWSARREATGHANTDVDTRWNSWNAGPSTCSAFKKCSEVCGNCTLCEGPEAIQTPLTLGRAVPTPDPHPVPVVVTNPVKEIHLQEYVWKNGMMVFYPTAPKEGEPPATPYSYSEVYLKSRVRDAEGNHAVIAVMYDPQGEVREVEISTKSIMVGGAQLMQDLGKHEIVVAENKGAMNVMCAYLKKSLVALKKSVAITRSFRHFGWQEDGTFLIGNRLYTKEGISLNNRLAGSAHAQAKMFPTPTGSAEAYATALDTVFNREGMEPFQYAIASMWGAPLAALVEDTLYQGIPCALTGTESGRGKTTAFSAGLYAFGDARAMATYTEEGATQNARVAMMATLSNLPMLIDELTNIGVNDLSNLMYVTSSGSDKARMRVNKASGGVDIVESETWRTHVGMTGNTSLTDRLASKGNSEAETMRLFEIRIDSYEIPRLPTEVVAEQMNNMAVNMGCAGDVYISYVVNHQAEIAVLLKDMLNRVSKVPEIGNSPKCRFLRWHMACSLTACRIMHGLGLCNFNLDRLIKFAVGAVLKILSVAKDRYEKDPEEILCEFIEDIAPDTLVTPTMKVSPLEKIPNKSYKARLIRNDGKLQEKDRESGNGRFIVSRKALRDWCSDKRYCFEEVESKLRASGVLLRRDARLVITKGVEQLSMIRTWADVFDLTKLDNADEVLKTSDEAQERLKGEKID